MNIAAGGNVHEGDSILLLPPSQTSTPAVSTPGSSSTFHKDENPASNSHSPAPSLSLSHRGSAMLPPSSPSPPQHLEVPAYNLPASASSNSNSAASSVPASRGQEGSRSSLVFHQYAATPYQSFMRYLSTPASDRTSASAGFHPWAQTIPPWLIPQYHGKRPIVRSTVLRPLCRLLLLAVILAVLIASTLLYSFRSRRPELSNYSAVQDFEWTPINPRSYLSPMNASFGDQYDVLLDGHSHTTYSDGRMTPETLLKWHIANGYNAVIVSDHNTIEGGLATQKLAQEKYADKITVIPAMELTCCRLHMNLIGINETIDIAITKWPTDEQLKATIARTHELGGLAIINHIPWSNTTEYGYQLPRMQNHPSREALVEMGIDGFEVANGDTLDTLSLKFLQDHNLLLMTGTDVHYPDSTAYSWLILDTNNNRTAANIMAQLRARKTSFLFDPVGTQKIAYPPESAKYYKTAPPTLLGQYFQMFWTDQTGMYSFMPEGGFCHQETVTIRWSLIGYFIGWILVGFLLFEAARLLVVGCCWGPFQRRRKYLRKKKYLDEEGHQRDDVEDPLHTSDREAHGRIE
ncbi:hypothetical protein KVV02_008062 [Mortierella alpina]|uniref:Polymerase/histidinol phosphatase N-terminal domain-containing protein n=1 Tax=Mortierella alpina TaxID=64518 RepID=A0A9P8A005_MORAP|nr:hypothetical protein KVV02_008062 [Mortierella alpina]